MAVGADVDVDFAASRAGFDDGATAAGDDGFSYVGGVNSGFHRHSFRFKFQFLASVSCLSEIDKRGGIR